MSGRKNIFQQHGIVPNPVQGKNIWARNDSFNGMQVEVYCKGCGKVIEMPSREGPGAYSMDIYHMELQHRIHQDCARELDRRGANY